MEKSILFVGGSSGSGHIQAAQNLIKSIKHIDTSVEAEFINIFDYLSPFARFILEDLWEFSSLHLESLYRFTHNAIVKNKYLSDIIKRRFIATTNRIAPIFLDKKFFVYVATHPAAAIIGSLLKHRHNFIFSVVPTDFVLHNFHFYPEVDFYYLPPDCSVIGLTPHAENYHRKSLITGIPISPAFWDEKNEIELRKEFGLSPDRLTVLISFGGKGLGAEKHINMLRVLLKLALPLQFIIIAGENRPFEIKLRELLSIEKNNRRVKIFGFVKNMADIMTASDIFIGKAGGLSLSEALAKGLPIAILESLPGQEDYNTTFIVSNNLGIKVNNQTDLVQWLHSLLSLKALSEWKNRVKNFGRPFSGYDIASHILGTIKIY